MKTFILNYQGTEWIETSNPPANSIPIELFDKIDGEFIFKGVGLYGNVKELSCIEKLPPNIVCATSGFINYNLLKLMYDVAYCGNGLTFWKNRVKG